MSLMQRLCAVRDELQSAPAITVRRQILEPARAPVEVDYDEDELVSEGEGFRLDDAMRATWSEVARMDIEWLVDTTGAGDGPGGALFLPPLLQFVRPAFEEDDLADMAPASDETRALLLSVRLLDVHDAGHWTAVRARPGQPAELWYRQTGADGRSPLDLPLRGDFATYLDTLISARGADAWPLLLLDPGVVPRDARRAVLEHCAALRRALDALATVPTARADALAMSIRATDLARALR